VQDADVIIIGSGMGGATMAAQLAPSGRKILNIERGIIFVPLQMIGMTPRYLPTDIFAQMKHG
tara:strand:+ start:733 stop:921 length:189 start_codon:yes stop_codon:yes gene_type:complete